MDWTSSLHHSSETVLSQNGVVVNFYTNPSTIGDIAGSSFKGFSGSKPLFETKGMPLVFLSNLYDEARNAINSGLVSNKRGTIGSNFGRKDFTISHVYVGERRHFQCTLNHLEDIEYNRVGRCLLCDQIAALLIGEHVSGKDGTVDWCFESPNAAKDFLLLCIWITTGSWEHYVDLHRRARRAHRRSIQAAKTVTAGTSKRVLDSLQESETFVLGFARDRRASASQVSEEIEIPFFYLIGNLHEKGPTHERQSPFVNNDFCIVLADLGFYRRMFGGSSNSGRRISRNDIGRALYLRPIAKKNNNPSVN